MSDQSFSSNSVPNLSFYLPSPLPSERPVSDTSCFIGCFNVCRRFTSWFIGFHYQLRIMFCSIDSTFFPMPFKHFPVTGIICRSTSAYVFNYFSNSYSSPFSITSILWKMVDTEVCWYLRYMCLNFWRTGELSALLYSIMWWHIWACCLAISTSPLQSSHQLPLSPNIAVLLAPFPNLLSGPPDSRCFPKASGCCVLFPAKNVISSSASFSSYICFWSTQYFEVCS